MKKIAILFSLVQICLFAKAQTISTIAGGYIGNGVSAKSMGISPEGVAVDKLGNIYVSDNVNDVVRKINPSTGIMTLMVGSGSIGYSGDGGAATSAKLYLPEGLALDTSGNIYIADMFNSVIRKVTVSTGIITTVAGNGYGANSTSPIYFGGYSGDGGPATSAELSRPNSVVVDDSGNIYISDAGNNRIRKVTAATGIINTVIGNGLFGYSGDGGPATSAEIRGVSGLALDAQNNIYIADTYNNRIRKISIFSGLISTIAGNGISGFSGDGGPAVSAELSSPYDITVDTAGNIYIADAINYRIRKITVSTGIINTIAGNGIRGYSGDGGIASSAELDLSTSLTIDASHNVFIVDFSNYVVREMKASNNFIYTIAGNATESYNGDGMIATNGELAYPSGLTVDGLGNVFIADWGNNRIREINASTGFISTFAGNGQRGYNGDNINCDSAELNGPNDLLFDGKMNMYIIDQSNNRVREINNSHIITTYAGKAGCCFNGNNIQADSAILDFPSGIGIDPNGNIYIADTYNGMIRKVDAATGIITRVAGGGKDGDGGPADSAFLNQPQRAAFDNSGNMYIADWGNSRVRKVNLSTGIISTIAGTGKAGYSGDGGPADSAQLNFPTGVALDPKGRLFISDQYNNRIRMVDLGTFTIYTVAGNGVQGFAGDGGNANTAELDVPENVAFDASGNMYIADNGNNRIRKVTAPLGIKELSSSNNSIKVFPNPSNGLFQLRIKNYELGGTVKIYNMLGQEVASSNSSEGGEFKSLPSGGFGWAIDISNQPSGIYLYRVTNSEGALVGSGKLVIN